jgi:outer membrane protein assembly factor BamD
MKRSLPILLVAAGLLAVACGSAAKDDPILRLSAEESLAEGRRLYEAEKFAQSRPYFQHAFEVEPNSAVGREALLLVADSLYHQSAGGLLVQAEAKYRDYLNRFPTSDKAPYVQLQIARALLRGMERPDRDQQTTLKALAAFEELLRLYPSGEFTQEAQEGMARVRTNLAEHEFLVARFYLRFGLPPAAVNRLEALLEQYPDYSERDKAMLHLVLAYRRIGAKDRAQETVSKLRAEYPGSPWLKQIPKEMR